MTSTPEYSATATQSAATRLPAWVLPAATAAVLGLAYGPLLATYFAQQWARPHYQYFPFVLGAFAWLLWRNSERAQPKQQVDSKLRRFGVIAILASSWVLLAQAYFSESPLLAVISAILLVAGGFLQIGARWRVEYLWGIWALLWLMVRPPLNRDQILISKLQHLSSKLSSLFLDTAGIDHLMEGNTLILPDKQFFVDEACSGIVSVLSIIACAVIYGVWRNRPPLHVALLAVAGIGWATLMNVLRITTIAVVYANWGLDWSAGMSHEILGLVIFTFIFLALVSTDYLFLGLLAPIVPAGHASLGEPIHVGAKVVAAWDWMQTWGAPQWPPAGADGPAPDTRRSWELTSRLALGLVPLLAFAALAGAQMTMPYWFGGGRMAATQSLERALSLDASVLPATIGDMQRAGFSEQERKSDDVFGHHSRVYDYRDAQGNMYMVSCDFPFGPEWHELTVCYNGIGWELRERTARQDSNAHQPWGFVEAAYTRPDGSAAWLVYSVFDEYGDQVDPPTGSFFSDFWRSVEKKRRWAQNARLFQIQVWTTASGSVREPQREAARKLLLDVREMLRQSVTQSAAPSAVPKINAEPAAAVK